MNTAIWLVIALMILAFSGIGYVIVVIVAATIENLKKEKEVKWSRN